jgi:hypothetical protein
MRFSPRAQHGSMLEPQGCGCGGMLKVFKLPHKATFAFAPLLFASLILPDWQLNQTKLSGNSKQINKVKRQAFSGL